MTNTNEIELKSNNDIKEGLLRAFPTKESFYSFKNNDHKISYESINTIIEYSKKNNLILINNESELIQFIETNHSIYLKDNSINLNITFEAVIQDVCKDNSDNSCRILSSNSLIEELNKIALILGLPEIKASMLSRLKKSYNLNTEKKRALIRVLSFWIGYKRPHLPWDYNSLAKLSFKLHKNEIMEKEGTRIDFSFEQPGEIIDYQMMEWLQNSIRQCIIDLFLFPTLGNKIKFTSTTTVTIIIDKNAGPSNEPRLYSSGIRSALAIAHQIIVRWALAEENKNKSSVIVAIAAGNYLLLPAQLKTLLASHLPENSFIKLTDFARLCVRTTDAKVIFSPEPQVVKMDNGTILNIWSVNYFWFLYYDFIPCLLKEDMLPVSQSSYDEFRELIYFPEHPNQSSKFKAIQAMRQFPQNSLLAIETAKVCLARRMFTEAKLIISNTFSSDPFNPVARSLQMLIYLNLAMEQDDPALFDIFFDRAKKEGDFILEHCAHEEEIWCEYGLLYWTKTFYTLKRIRSGLMNDVHLRQQLINSIKLNIQKSEESFQKGMMFSPTVNRPGFWIVHLQSLLMILESDNSMYHENLITDTAGAYALSSIYFFISLGWIDYKVINVTDEKSIVEQLNIFSDRMELGINTYNDSVQLSMYKPNVAFSIATVLWDFSPIMTVGIAKKTLLWLEEAKRQAEKSLDINIGIFSIISWYSQIQSPKKFIQCLDNSIESIKTIVEDDLGKDNDFIIDSNKLNGTKLFTQHFNEDVKTGPLFPNI